MMYLLLVLSIGATPVQDAEDAAQKSAEAWLDLVDEGRYDESWEEAAALVQAAVTKDDWGRSIASARRPLGKLVARTLKSRTYTETLPGAPDGQYVVIQYDTTFENKKSAVETITPVMDSGGRWRVSGYYIK